MIEITDVRLELGGRTVLDTINFVVPETTIFGIAGESGSGKSSLLKIMTGNLDASSGTVLFKNKRVVGPSERLIPGHPDIQLVNQDFALDVYHSVEENLRNKMVHLHRSQQVEFIDELLELLQLQHVRKQQALNLSGGEQQRLAIGRALAKEPEVLILDEPFAHLDANTKLRLLNYLKALQKIQNVTLILVSHDARDLLSLCNHLIVMEQGQIIAEGAPKDLYYQMDNAILAGLFGVVNKVNFSGKSICFRPDQYEIEDHPEGCLALKFVQAHFMGEYYLSEFCTDLEESLFLTDKEPLPHVRFITIHKAN